MSVYVLDASAVLAVVFQEPGADLVAERYPGALVSSVNWSEVGAKVAERGADLDAFLTGMATTSLTIVPFDRAQAESAARLRRATRSLGLSLGDRACLALALARNATALTTDNIWAKLDVGPAIELVRRSQ